MGTQHRLIPFDRPLQGAHIAGQSKLYSESELAAMRAKAYREGYDAAHAFSDRQLLEFRGEVQALQQGLLQNLPGIEQSMMEQLRSTLPSLALELAKRLLAGFEPDEDQIMSLCTETLDELFPERENLELIVSPHDAELLTKHIPDLEARYPGLSLRADPSLSQGDCQVRSRFGLTDARMSAKLEALHHELAGAA
jgi:flagellar assembly protein FliH